MSAHLTIVLTIAFAINVNARSALARSPHLSPYELAKSMEYEQLSNGMGYDDNPSYAQGYFNGNDIEQPPEFHQNYENPRFDDRMRNNYDEQDKIPKEMPEPLPVPEALTGDKGVVFKKDGLQYRMTICHFKVCNMGRKRDTSHQRF